MEGTPTEPQGGQQPSEEELRTRIEEQLRQVRVQDLLVESAASIVNLTARRIGKADEQDLEQARIGIDAVRSLVGLLDPEPAGQVRNALSELQMQYARQAGETPGAPAEPEAEEGGAAEGQPEAPDAERKPPPGLWTPPGT